MRTRRQTALWWVGIGLWLLVLLAVGWPEGPASATSHVRDCPGVFPGAPSSHPDFQLNSRMSGWKEDPGRGGMILTLTCWYGTSTVTPTLAVSVTFVERLPQGMQRLPGTCGPAEAGHRNSQTRQVKASWSGYQFGLGAPLAEQLIQRMEGRAVTCQQAVLLVACDEWDVRLEDHQMTRWRGNWKRAPGAFGYTAVWERAPQPGEPTGERKRIERPVFVKPGDALQFVSEDRDGTVITYYSRPFGGDAGEIKGDYEQRFPRGPVVTGTWRAHCVDPGPFRRTWTP